MAGSYESINYALRPAKVIERKMLCEAFARLAAFDKLVSYRYLGFGSTYFSDFSLVHRLLGITKNTSMERDLHNRSRFEFNRPYSCIELQFGESNDILPRLSWDVKTIAWLDYDRKMGQEVLSDIAFFCAKALPGSVLVVTVNAHPDKFGRRVSSLEGRFEGHKIPPNISEANLGDWGTAATLRRIITNQIEETLAQRNGGVSPSAHLQYRQIFNFHYADGAKMLTVGGLLYEKSQADIIEKCSFDTLDFVRGDNVAFCIDVPCLTSKEIRYLNCQLPTADASHLRAESVPPNDLQAYARIYRYFPRFVDADMD